MIYESQRCGRFKQFSAGEFHAVAGVGGMLVGDFTVDFPDHNASLEPPAREHTAAHVGGSDANEPPQAVAIVFQKGGMLWAHGARPEKM